MPHRKTRPGAGTWGCPPDKPHKKRRHSNPWGSGSEDNDSDNLSNFYDKYMSQKEKKLRNSAPSLPEPPQNEAYERYLAQMQQGVQNAPYSAPKPPKNAWIPPNHLQGNALQSKLGTKIGSADEEFGYTFQEKLQNQQQNRCCCQDTNYPEPNVNEHGGVGLAYRNPVLTSVLDMPFGGKGAGWGKPSNPKKKEKTGGVKIVVKTSGVANSQIAKIDDFTTIVLKDITTNIQVDADGYLSFVDKSKMNEFDKAVQPYLENKEQTVELILIKNNFDVFYDSFLDGILDVHDWDKSIYYAEVGSIKNAIDIYRGALLIHILAERFAIKNYQKEIREVYIKNEETLGDDYEIIAGKLDQKYLPAHFKGLQEELKYIQNFTSRKDLNPGLIRFNMSPAGKVANSEESIDKSIDINWVDIEGEKYIWDRQIYDYSSKKVVGYDEIVRIQDETHKGKTYQKIWNSSFYIQEEWEQTVMQKSKGREASMKIKVCFKE